MQELQETQVLSLGREDPLEKEMTTHSSVLAWKIRWTEEPGGLHSMGPQRVGHNLTTEHTHVSVCHSLCCIPENNTTLEINYTPIKIKKEIRIE